MGQLLQRARNYQPLTPSERATLSEAAELLDRLLEPGDATEASDRTLRLAISHALALALLLMAAR